MTKPSDPVQPLLSRPADGQTSRVRRPSPTSFRTKVVLGIVAVILAFAPLTQTGFYSCATCGDRLRGRSFLGISMGKTEEVTDCGRWFRENLEPKHTHVWCRGTYAEATSLLGFPTWPSNLLGRASGPVVTLGSGLKLALYQCASNPHKVRDILLGLATWDRSTPEGVRGQWRRLQELEKWGAEGCQGDPPGAPGRKRG